MEKYGMEKDMIQKKNLIYELKDGKGNVEEVDDDGKTYMGQYLNGEKNGKGKEYEYDDELQYEGEYLNGKRNGKGKEYYEGKLIFEGEYLNGEKWKGYLKIYDDDELIFEGELLDHFKRKGREYFKGKLEFKGEYLVDKKWTGKTYDENGKIIYEMVGEKQENMNMED